MALYLVCGICGKHLVPKEGGVVLSCGDFLCVSCLEQSHSSGQCEVCGKQGVRSAPLNHNLPEEVRDNISDPAIQLEKLHSVLVFQIPYYKQTIRRLQARVYELEAKLRNYES